MLYRGSRSHETGLPRGRPPAESAATESAATGIHALEDVSVTTTMLGTTRAPVPACTRTLLGKTMMMVLALTVPTLLNQNVPGGEPGDAVDADAPIPDAQVGSLYPLLKATAARSSLELSFLHHRFTDLEAWKRESRPKILSLLRYDPPKCDPRPR